MFGQLPPQSLNRLWQVGFAADPAIDVLLDKSRIAQIRIRQLEQVVQQLQNEIELAKMEQQMLREEYKLK